MARRRASSGIAACLLLGLAAGVPATAADDAPAVEPRWERAARLCEAWTAAKYLHPRLWSPGVDWDAAYVTAVTAATADPAAPTSAYRAVAAAMLAGLDDAATRVAAASGTEEAGGEEAAAAPGTEADAPVALARELSPAVFLLDLPGLHRARGRAAIGEELGEFLTAGLPGARGVVVDLRYGDDTSWFAASSLDDMATQLVPARVVIPGERWMEHHGFAPQAGTTSGGYWSGVVTSPGRELRPAGEGGAWRFVFLLDEQSVVPDVALALRAAGHALFVRAGEEGSAGNGRTVAIDLGEGLTARVRISEVAWPDGSQGPPDRFVAASRDADGDDAAVALAQAALRDGWASAPADPASAGGAGRVLAPERDYPEMRHPDAGHRLLAACRAWGVIHHFYPYLDLVGDWDAAYRAALPAFHAAADETAYVRAVLALMAHVADGHTSVWGHPAVAGLLGAAGLPLEVRWIEEQPVVTAVSPDVTGVRVGDVLRSVDGEAIGDRVARLLPLVAGSSDLTRRTRALRRALAGPRGSTAALEVEGADGLRRAEVARAAGGAPFLPWASDGPAWQRLPSGFGYVDLRRLEVPQVAPMLAELADAPALIFDMRGYPNGVAWALAPLLNHRDARIAAQFRGRQLSPTTWGLDAAGFFFAQPIPDRPPGAEVYRGRTVMLIDDRAISQSEHTGLFLEAASGTTFVGQPTAGANGDVTVFVLPGGLRVGFTGHDVRHADGRQLQRVGLQPHVPAAPTIAGVRAGRDELLEAAVVWLREQGAASEGGR